jgi:hypothetical protein
MTWPVWTTWFSAVTVYLGAFLAGIRPGAWLGTRLAPLAAAGGVLAVAEAIATLSGVASFVLFPLVLIVADIALITSILFTAETRDFA